MPKKVMIYTTKVCPYCVKAKSLFERKGVAYTEIDVSSDVVLRQEMLEKSVGRKTVPQIFIDNYHVGGCDDLYALEDQKRLDKLLGIAD